MPSQRSGTPALYTRPMSSAVSPTVSATLARYAPRAGEAVEAMHAAAWETLDPTLLELCRRRMAMLHGDDAELDRTPPLAVLHGKGGAIAPAKLNELGSWPDSPAFTAAERACLAFTELFVADVSSITQPDVDAILGALGPAQVYGFVTALLFLDQQQRLRLAFERILGPVEVSA